MTDRKNIILFSSNSCSSTDFCGKLRKALKQKEKFGVVFCGQFLSYFGERGKNRLSTENN
jgi:thioredoxin-related protein